MATASSTETVVPLTTILIGGSALATADSNAGGDFYAPEPPASPTHSDRSDRREAREEADMRRPPKRVLRPPMQHARMAQKRADTGDRGSDEDGGNHSDHPVAPRLAVRPPRPCQHMALTGTCKYAETCRNSHDPTIIANSRATMAAQLRVPLDRREVRDAQRTSDADRQEPNQRAKHDNPRDLTTRPCRFFAAGDCHSIDCPFLHVGVELKRVRPEPAPTLFRYTNTLTESQLDQFARIYGKNVAVEHNGPFHEHPFLKRDRMDCTAIAIAKMGPVVSIHNVGGNPRRNIDDREWHSCPPIFALDVAKAVDYDQYKNWCKHRGEDCKCRAFNVALFVHSIYYFTPDQIAQVLRNTTRQVGYAVMHVFDGIGSFAGEADYRVDAKGNVTMKVKGNDHAYTHSAMPWFRECSRAALTGGSYLVWDQVHSTAFGTKIFRFTVTKLDVEDDVCSARGLPFQRVISDQHHYGPVHYGLPGDEPGVARVALRELKVPDLRGWSWGDVFIFGAPHDSSVYVPKGLIGRVALKALFTLRTEDNFRALANSLKPTLATTNLPTDLHSDALLGALAAAYISGISRETETLEQFRDYATDIARNSLTLTGWAAPRTWPGYFARLFARLPTWAQSWLVTGSRVIALYALWRIVAFARRSSMAPAVRAFAIKTLSMLFGSTATLRPRTTTTPSRILSVLTRAYECVKRAAYTTNPLVASLAYLVRRAMPVREIDGHTSHLQAGDYHYLPAIMSVDATCKLDAIRPETKVARPTEYTGTHRLSNILLGVGLGSAPQAFSTTTHNTEVAIRNRCSRQPKNMTRDDPAYRAAWAQFAAWVRRNFKRLFPKAPGAHTAIWVPRPMPLVEWLARFPGWLQATLLQAHDQVAAGDAGKWRRVCAFPKREKGVTFLADPDHSKAPRAIMSSTPHLNVMLGPWLCAFMEALKKSWTVGHTLVYGAGLTGDAIGASMHANVSTGLTNVRECDYARYDSTRSRESFDLERYIYARCGAARARTADGRTIASIFGELARTSGVTRGNKGLGTFRYSIVDFLASGRPYTTSGNTLICALIEQYAAERTWKQPATRGSFVTYACGDDRLTFTARPLPLKNPYETSIGLEAEPQLRQHWWEATFCSMRLYPVMVNGEHTIRLAPFLGRIGRFGWYNDPPADALRHHRPFVRGMALSINAMASGVPFLRTYIKHSLRLTAYAGSAAAHEYTLAEAGDIAYTRDHQRRMQSSLMRTTPCQPTDETYGMLNHVYGLNPTDEQAFDAELATVRSVPALRQPSWYLNAVDVDAAGVARALWRILGVESAIDPTWFWRLAAFNHQYSMAPPGPVLTYLWMLLGHVGLEEAVKAILAWATGSPAVACTAFGLYEWHDRSWRAGGFMPFLVHVATGRLSFGARVGLHAAYNHIAYSAGGLGSTILAARHMLRQRNWFEVLIHTLGRTRTFGSVAIHHYAGKPHLMEGLATPGTASPFRESPLHNIVNRLRMLHARYANPLRSRTATPNTLGHLDDPASAAQAAHHNAVMHALNGNIPSSAAHQRDHDRARAPGGSDPGRVLRGESIQPTPTIRVPPAAHRPSWAEMAAAEERATLASHAPSHRPPGHTHDAYRALGQAPTSAGRAATSALVELAEHAIVPAAAAVGRAATKAVDAVGLGGLAHRVRDALTSTPAAHAAGHPGRTDPTPGDIAARERFMREAELADQRRLNERAEARAMKHADAALATPTPLEPPADVPRDYPRYSTLDRLYSQPGKNNLANRRRVERAYFAGRSLGFAGRPLRAAAHAAQGYVIEKNPGPPKTRSIPARRRVQYAPPRAGPPTGRRAPRARTSALGAPVRQPRNKATTSSSLRPAATRMGGAASQQFNKDGSLTVWGSDRLAPATIVDATRNAAGGVIMTYTFNPNNNNTIQLQQCGALFQKFEFTDFRVHFRTSQPTTIGGSIDILFDSDVGDIDAAGYGLAQQASTTSSAMETPVTLSQVWDYKAKREAGGIYYIYPDISSTAGLRQTFQAHFVLFVVNPITPAPSSYPYTIGSVLIEYKIRFYHRQTVPASISGGLTAEYVTLPPTVNTTSKNWFAAGGATGSTTFGSPNLTSYLAQLGQTNNTAGTLDGSANQVALTFNPGSYLVSYSVNNGAIISATTAVSIYSNITTGAGVIVIGDIVNSTPILTELYVSLTSTVGGVATVNGTNGTATSTTMVLITVKAGTVASRTVTFTIAAIGGNVPYTTPAPGSLPQSILLITPTTFPTQPLTARQLKCVPIAAAVHDEDYFARKDDENLGPLMLQTGDPIGPPRAPGAGAPTSRAREIRLTARSPDRR